jgi:3,4-dihydroxy 2-butanone 4-phosphate synthase/GTP cyclohydrolase II
MVVRPFATVDAALADVRAGRMVVVCDDEHPDAEGTLTVAADHAGADAINFMARHGRGLVCLALTPERCEELALDPMAARNGSRFTVSVEARHGVTTGISAADRAQTIRVAIDPGSARDDLVQPGHVFPIRTRPGGVLEHPGRAEAAIDLARLAGCRPAGVTCEVLNEDGTTARVADLVHYCAEHGLALVTVSALADHRRGRERTVERVAEAALPTSYGTFTAVGYRCAPDDLHHVALVQGDPTERGAIALTHAECLGGDVFGAADCGCGHELERSLERLGHARAGVLVYLSAGRGASWVEGLGRHRGAPSPAAHAGVAELILRDLGAAGRGSSRSSSRRRTDASPRPCLQRR